MAQPSDTVTPGTPVSLSAGHVGRHPHWLRFASSTALEGIAEGFGIQRVVSGTGTGSSDRSYLVAPNIDEGDYARLTGGELNVVIMEPTARRTAFFLRDDASRGYISCEVRLARDAPARAVVEFPRQYGPDDILSDGFRWEPPSGGGTASTGPVERGYLLLVYRGSELLFGGRIREIERGSTVTVTAYDRLMELGLFSAQYQPSTATNYFRGIDSSRGITEQYYRYQYPQEVGTIDYARTKDRLRISSLDDQTQRDQFIAGYLHTMPWAYDSGDTLYEPVAGDTLMRLQIHRTYELFPIANRPRYDFVVGYIDLATRQLTILGKYTPENDVLGVSKSYVDIDLTLPPIGSGQAYVVGVYTTKSPDNIEYYGLDASRTVTSGETFYLRFDSSRYVYLVDPWTASWYPEIAVDFIHDGTVVTSQVTADGSQVLLPSASVPAGPQGNCLATVDAAVHLYVEFYIADSLSVRSLVRDLLGQAGLWDWLEGTGYGDLGTIDYYTTGTHDWLTCIRDLINPLDLGLVTDETGMVVLAPHASVGSGAVLTASTEGEGTGILSHSLTRRWMATADVRAVITEDSEGRPWAVESDDLLMEDPYIDDMGIMRQVESDKSLGSPGAQADAAGGGVRQGHYNIIEGEVVLAGYHPEIWNFFHTCAVYPAVNTGAQREWPTPSFAGGNPIRIVIPDEGIDEVAVPTEVTFKGGQTVVKLDNIRSADRSDVAQSMGLTADLVSDSALTETVYIHARAWSYLMQEAGVSAGDVTGTVSLYAEGTAYTGVTWSKTAMGYDLAGYMHIVATGTATASSAAAIGTVSMGTASGEVYADVDVPIPVLNGQKVVVDIRFRESSSVAVPRPRGGPRTGSRVS